MKSLPFKMIVETEMEKYRRDTWDTKEPETIAWIKSFKAYRTFFDIGANIGIYSLYCAAIHPSIKVIAFEPMLNNFIRLVENIKLNNFCNIIPIYMALGKEKASITEFSMNGEIGISGGQTNEYRTPYKNIVPCATLKDILDRFPESTPIYIKIDVDGKEWDILSTAQYCELHTVTLLVEVNRNRKQIMEWAMHRHLTDDNEFNRHPNHSRIRRAKEGIKAENVIFTRK